MLVIKCKDEKINTYIDENKSFKILILDIILGITLFLGSMLSIGFAVIYWIILAFYVIERAVILNKINKIVENCDYEICIKNKCYDRISRYYDEHFRNMHLKIEKFYKYYFVYGLLYGVAFGAYAIISGNIFYFAISITVYFYVALLESTVSIVLDNVNKHD